MTVDDIRNWKVKGVPLVAVTAYDCVSAAAAEAAGVDVVLVGDSAGMTMLGYESTRQVSLPEMLMLTAAVARALRTPLLVGDLPFGSYEASNDAAVETGRRFLDAGCAAVKLEGAGVIADRAKALIEAGIPVMGHVGLTPQQVGAGQAFRVQGRTSRDALRVVQDAMELQRAGCFSIVFEAIPASVVDLIVPRLSVPAIGIGAGSRTDGQILVFHDLVGMTPGRTPRFVKRYANVGDTIVSAVRAYADDVRSGRFPSREHYYEAGAEEVTSFRAALKSLRTEV